MKNLGVIDTKPKNAQVIDTRPKNTSINVEFTNRVYEQVLTAGMYMGIPPFTYPEAGTVQSPFSP